MRRCRPRWTIAVLVPLAVIALTLGLLAGCGDGGDRGSVERDIQYGVAEGEPLLLDVYRPGGSDEPRPAVLIFHGGAWRAGDKASVAAYAMAAVARGFVAVAVGYRLREPEAFPAELQDAITAVLWTRANAEEHGIDPARIGAMGSSSGGHLVALLGTVPTGPLTEAARVRAVVSWSGPMDLPALTVPNASHPPGCMPPDCITAEQWTGLFNEVIGCPLAGCPARYLILSPTASVTPDDSPMLLVNGAQELIVPLAQAHEMHARLSAAGVPSELLAIPGDDHADGFAATALEPSLDFLERHLGTPPAVG